MLAKEQPYVRSIDIATELGFSKPSVSVAMKNLRQNGYVQMDDQGHITLTPSGQAIADTMYERHTLLSNWLIYLGVDPRTAAEDACRMEHIKAYWPENNSVGSGQVLHCPYMAADARLVVKEMTRQTERKQELDEYEKAALDEWESGLGPENKTSQFQSLSFGNICKVYLLQ